MTAALFLLAGLIAGCGQQTTTISGSGSQLSPIASGIVEDWSTHHVRFSNPGSEADAIRNGTHDKWLRIVNNPRYQMQQLRRNSPDRFRKAQTLSSKPLHRDWTFKIAPPNVSSSAYPAKYGFDINAAPQCSDYVVYTVATSGSTTQANIIGFNNLYDGTCPSSAPSGQPFAPTVKFAYQIGNGYIYGSPVLSLDGTKVAFVESTSSGSIFHVLTLGTIGNNGTAWNAPVQPCTVNGITSCVTNNAVDTRIAMVYNYPDYYSSPFVDYANDVAYVGDNAGTVHKLTGVFRGTPAENTTGWPYGIGATDAESPVYDFNSKHLFITAEGGPWLFCLDLSSANPNSCSTPNQSLGAHGYASAAPIVDSTAETVFAVGYYPNATSGYQSSLLQTDTDLGNPVQVNLGYSNYGPSDGDFDLAYYNGNYASGYLYACGGGTTSTYNAYATLYRIGFDSSGKMNASTDGNSYQLASSTATCTPLTEVYNASQNIDYLFLGLSGYGAPASCTGQACIMSFVLPSPGSAFPSAPAAGYPLGASGVGISGIIVDNVSNLAGTSQIYFQNSYSAGGTSSNATQLSQSGLN